MKECDRCKGTGERKIGENITETCVVCAGKGFIELYIPAEKTLLDEFAMAALVGAMSGPSQTRTNGRLCEDSNDYALFSYDFAAAMMREKMRRDEAGNIKEENE